MRTIVLEAILIFALLCGVAVTCIAASGFKSARRLQDAKRNLNRLLDLPAPSAANVVVDDIFNAVLVVCGLTVIVVCTLGIADLSLPVLLVTGVMLLGMLIAAAICVVVDRIKHPPETISCIKCGFSYKAGPAKEGTVYPVRWMCRDCTVAVGEVQAAQSL